MSQEPLVFVLGKVLIATAWADGEISESEINCLKDLLFKIEKLASSDWARLQIYIETPVSDAERGRLVDDLGQAIASSDDKAEALAVLEQVCQADGVFSDAERIVFDEIRSTIADTPTGFRIIPCVGSVPFPLKTCVNEAEIADYFSVPVLAFANPRLVEEREVDINGTIRALRIYHIGNRRVWGLTARIVQNLLQRLGLEENEDAAG